MVDFWGSVTLDLDFKVLSVAQEVSSPWESLAPRAPGATEASPAWVRDSPSALCTLSAWRNQWGPWAR